MTLAAVAPIGASRADADEPIYTYTNGAGTPIYVQGLQAVPPEYRSAARRMDVSQDDPNAKLGNGIRDSMNERYRELEEQQAKERARVEAEIDKRDGVLMPETPTLPLGRLDASCSPFTLGQSGVPRWQAAWSRFPVAIVTGAMCLALILATPVVSRSVSLGRWCRLLFWMVPMLLFFGALGQAVRGIHLGARSVQEALAGGPCSDGARVKPEPY
jgi:hypothetical protein